jgi:hypothetical protein
MKPGRSGSEACIERNPREREAQTIVELRAVYASS